MRGEALSFDRAPSGRSELAGGMARRLSGEGPRGTLLRSPRGWGRRGILEEAASSLRAAGRKVVEIDPEGFAVHPDEFACAFAASFIESAFGEGASPVAVMSGGLPPLDRLRALDVTGRIEGAGEVAAAARELLRTLAAPRGGGPAAVRIAFGIPALLAREAGGPLPLVVHNIDAIARLSRYPGLAAIEELAAAALAAEGTRFLASLSPAGRPAALIGALHAAMGPELEGVDLPPAGIEEISTSGTFPPIAPGTAAALLAATGGRLLTMRILAPRLAAGGDLEQALAAGFEPADGRLFHELRFDYHLLIERTRGHAASRAVLNLLAREEGLDLSGIAARLRRSPGSTLDYLRWLVEVALVAREGRRYRFADPLLRLYVLLHEVPERPRDASGRLLVVRRFVAGLGSAPRPLRPLGRPRGRRTVALTRPPARKTAPAADDAPAAPPRDGDDLMEID